MSFTCVWGISWVKDLQLQRDKECVGFGVQDFDILPTILEPSWSAPWLSYKGCTKAPRPVLLVYSSLDLINPKHIPSYCCRHALPVG